MFVYDNIATEGPATFDWLLHALEEMTVEPDAGEVTIRRGRARLAVKLLSAVPVDFSQTRGFPVPPEERATGAPDQWHLAARTRSPAVEAKFLAALVPYRAEEKRPEIAAITDGSAAGLRIGDTRIAVWWKSGGQGNIDMEGLRGTGRLVIETPDGQTKLSVVHR